MFLDERFKLVSSFNPKWLQFVTLQLDDKRNTRLSTLTERLRAIMAGLNFEYHAMPSSRTRTCITGYALDGFFQFPGKAFKDAGVDIWIARCEGPSELVADTEHHSSESKADLEILQYENQR